MSIPPKAGRVSDSHSCPQHPGPYGYQPATNIIPPGKDTVIICNKPAARVTDQLNCGAKIISGEATVLIGGKPAARLGDSSDHGGCIASGCSTVFIGKPAPAKCLQGNSAFAEEEGSPSDESLNSIKKSAGATPSNFCQSSNILNTDNILKNNPLNKNFLDLLGGKNALDFLGGIENVNMINQGLGIAGNTLNLMGKSNPLLNKISGGLNLLNGNALSQVGGALSLMGEDKAGGALSLLGGAVGGGDALSLASSAAHLMGEDKFASILNLAGNPTNVINEVMKITGKEENQTVAINTQNEKSGTDNSLLTSTEDNDGNSANILADVLDDSMENTGEEGHNSAAIETQHDNDPFM